MNKDSRSQQAQLVMGLAQAHHLIDHIDTNYQVENDQIDQILS